MVINIGISNTEMAALTRLLFTHHRVRVQLTITDLNHSALGQIGKTLLGGEVIFDATSDIQRQMNLELFDPDRKVALDPEDPSQGAAYPSRMIKCVYSVGTMDGSKWYDIPLFHGPVNKVDRTGPILRVECLGKELLSLGGLWTGISGYNNTNKVDLAVHMMRARVGEAFFDVAPNKAKTTKAIAVDKEKWTLWGYVRTMMSRIGMQAFYNGEGDLRIRALPQTASIAFDATRMMDLVDAGFDVSGFWNTVKVVGAIPKGKKTPLYAIRTLEAKHPLSQSSLKRNGVNFIKPKIETNSDLDTQAEVNDRAVALLKEGALQAVDVAVPVPVFPLLEENDMVLFQSDAFTATQRARKFTVPLTVNNPQMSIGYTLNVKPTALSAKIRRP